MNSEKDALFEILRDIVDNGSDELIADIRRDLDQVFNARARDEDLQMAAEKALRP
jgi:hypothetical protein